MALQAAGEPILALLRDGVETVGGGVLVESNPSA